MASSSAILAAPPERETCIGTLVNPQPWLWQVVCSSNGSLGYKVLDDYRVDCWGVIGHFGIAKIGGRVILARMVDAKTAEDGGDDVGVL
eukprot:3633172-Pyramimonas_sp.AAC.1